MILRYGQEPDELFFVESTSEIGVSVLAWSDIQEYIGDFYQKIVYRHLKWARPDKSIDILEQFLEETKDAKYKFSLQYLKNRKRNRMTSDLNF